MVDFDYLRAKALSPAARAVINQKEADFNNRLKAVGSQEAPSPINWAHYKEALPEYDIDGLQAAFEKYMEGMPAIAYDEGADLATHGAEEASWQSFSDFAAARLEELAKLKADGEEHKLHEYYTLNRTFQRFDGLLEKEWLEWRNLHFHQNLRSVADIPSELSEEEKAQLGKKIAAKAGVTPEMLGVKA